MRRTLPALAVLAATICALTASTSTTQAAATCTDSWGNDGHAAPWYTAPSTLHGNTVVITCPNGSTRWAVNYIVEKIVNGNVFFPIDVQDKEGTGSTSFSISTSPIGCNPGAPYYTEVHNRLTTGTIIKPGHDTAIC